ncbi:MAG: hypothetical protein V3574_02915 [Candidatus Moraniibacteriota bacterium]
MSIEAATPEGRKSHVAGGAFKNGAIKLFQENFLGTSISSIDQSNAQLYQSDHNFCYYRQPKGDCCPLY